METQKMMAILSLFLVATISTLCESYRPSPNHFTSCSYRDKVTFTLDKNFYLWSTTKQSPNIIQGCHCGRVATLCSKTGYPGAQEYFGCIRRDHARYGFKKHLYIQTHLNSLDIAARMTTVRTGSTQDQLLCLKMLRAANWAPAWGEALPQSSLPSRQWLIFRKGEIWIGGNTHVSNEREVFCVDSTYVHCRSR